MALDRYPQTPESQQHLASLPVVSIAKKVIEILEERLQLRSYQFSNNTHSKESRCMILNALLRSRR